MGGNNEDFKKSIHKRWVVISLKSKSAVADVHEVGLIPVTYPV